MMPASEVIPMIKNHKESGFTFHHDGFARSNEVFAGDARGALFCKWLPTYQVIQLLQGLISTYVFESAATVCRVVHCMVEKLTNPI